MSTQNPRPGKLGDEITQQEVARLKALYEEQGYDVKLEDRIETPNGNKGRRYLDIGLYVSIGALGSPLAGKVISSCNGCRPEDWELGAAIAALGLAGKIMYDIVVRVRGINVGLKKKNGDPIKREQLAQQDIENNWSQENLSPTFEFIEKPKT